MEKSLKIVKMTKERFSSHLVTRETETLCDLPQWFPIYDVSGMKGSSSDHNTCISKASGLCAPLSLCVLASTVPWRALRRRSQRLPNVLIQFCGNFWGVSGTEISNECKSPPPHKKNPLDIFKNSTLLFNNIQVPWPWMAFFFQAMLSNPHIVRTLGHRKRNMMHHPAKCNLGTFPSWINTSLEQTHSAF